MSDEGQLARIDSTQQLVLTVKFLEKGFKAPNTWIIMFTPLMIPRESIGFIWGREGDLPRSMAGLNETLAIKVGWPS